MCCCPKYPGFGGEELGVVFAEDIGDIKEVGELTERAETVEETLLVDEGRRRKGVKGDGKLRLGRR